MRVDIEERAIVIMKRGQRQPIEGRELLNQESERMEKGNIPST